MLNGKCVWGEGGGEVGRLGRVKVEVSEILSFKVKLSNKAVNYLVVNGS